jgi:hypothetical protein
VERGRSPLGLLRRMLRERPAIQCQVRTLNDHYSQGTGGLFVAQASIRPLAGARSPLGRPPFAIALAPVDWDRLRAASHTPY